MAFSRGSSHLLEADFPANRFSQVISAIDNFLFYVIGTIPASFENAFDLVQLRLRGFCVARQKLDQADFVMRIVQDFAGCRCPLETA